LDWHFWANYHLPGQIVHICQPVEHLLNAIAVTLRAFHDLDSSRTVMASFSLPVVLCLSAKKQQLLSSLLDE